MSHVEASNCTVYEAAMARMATIFTEFDNVYVSFSGGKDSGVMLNLALTYIRDFAPDRRIGVFHLDYEAQYSVTTEYVDRVYTTLGDTIDPIRCCVPLRCPTCTSMFETFWRPWDPEKRDIWVRPMPEAHLGSEDFDFITPDTSDYEFQERLSLWLHERAKAKRTCVLVGIRADESLDRWRTIVSDRNVNKFQELPWTTKVYPDVYNAYPIYDWKVEDIWAANAKFGWDYNHLYDLFYLAGVAMGTMRVASPFMHAAKAGLQLYRAIDPGVWGRMVGRVNGVNCTGLYGGTKALGWKSISKPSHFTWQQYALFLLDTLPEATSAGFRKKLETSLRFWKNVGGCLSEEAVSDLKRAGVEFEVGEASNYATTKLPIRMEYIDDIESREFHLIPSWKRLCLAVLKNDHTGKSMGFSLNKTETAQRSAALTNYKELEK